MPVYADPDSFRLLEGQFICTPLFDPEKRKLRGLYRPGSRGMQHSTAVVKVCRLGPQARLSGPHGPMNPMREGAEISRPLAPYFKDAEEAAATGAEWALSEHSCAWPFEEGQILLVPRVFSLVFVWPRDTCPEQRTYALGDLAFVIAVLEGDPKDIVENFEVLPPEDPYGRG